MVTHLEPDILECGVMWASGSITTNKASGDNGIPTELFPILNQWFATIFSLPTHQGTRPTPLCNCGFSGDVLVTLSSHLHPSTD